MGAHHPAHPTTPAEDSTPDATTTTGVARTVAVTVAVTATAASVVGGLGEGVAAADPQHRSETGRSGHHTVTEHLGGASRPDACQVSDRGADSDDPADSLPSGSMPDVTGDDVLDHEMDRCRTSGRRSDDADTTAERPGPDVPAPRSTPSPTTSAPAPAPARPSAPRRPSTRLTTAPAPSAAPHQVPLRSLDTPPPPGQVRTINLSTVPTHR